ncbi:MAG: RNA polymerase factor sigma-32 [Oligoflexales bacterium]|nr:RNA polymerase factor sigma-32 [Oligoflexales bacterium]
MMPIPAMPGPYLIKVNTSLSRLPVIVKKTSLAKLSPLDLYLKEIARYPLLEPEEEFALAERHFEKNDIAAAHRLITSNLRLVVKIAYDFRRAQAHLLDLIQEGNYGLMQAVKKFNPYKGVKLSSYAAWWIRAYILRYLMDSRSQVKIATTAAQRKLFYNLQKETERLLSEYDHVDPKMIANRLDVPERDVIEMQKRLGSHDISIDAPLSHDPDGSSSFIDILVNDEVESIEDLLVDRQIKEIFSQHLEEFELTLVGRDLDIFRERMLSEKQLTLQEVGDRYGITRERARQIEARIIKKLKDFVQNKKILDIKI